MKNIEEKRKVGRPKGSKNKIGVKVGRPKLENKRDENYIISLRVNKKEKELIEKVLKKMNLNSNLRGVKKIMFFKLVENFLNKKK